LVLRITGSHAPAPGGRVISPVSSAQSGRAADMLPQLTPQSIAAVSAASCARVLTNRGVPSASRSAKKTLLLVGAPRPSPVICRLPRRVPASGRPIR